jgi:hypothetical protein
MASSTLSDLLHRVIVTSHLSEPSLKGANPT